MPFMFISGVLSRLREQVVDSHPGSGLSPQRPRLGYSRLLSVFSDLVSYLKLRWWALTED